MNRVFNLHHASLGVLFYIALAWALLNTPKVLVQIAPTEMFFEYESVKAIEAPSGGPIKLVSTSARYYPLVMAYEDILYCDWNEDGNYAHVSSQRTNSIHAEKKDMAPTTWLYTAYVPSDVVKPTCFIRSRVTGMLYNVVKEMKPIQTEPFKLE